MFQVALVAKGMSRGDYIVSIVMFKDFHTLEFHYDYDLDLIMFETNGCLLI